MDENNVILDVAQMMNLTPEQGSTFIPIANEENKRLIELVDFLKKSRDDKTIINTYFKGRLTRLKESFHNAESEFDQNLKLIEAQKSQWNVEDHTFKLSDREEARMIQQLQEVQKEQEDMNSYEATTQYEIDKLNCSMQDLSENIQMTKVMLWELKNVIDSNEETSDLIEKYCKMDMSRAEALESRRRIVQVNIEKQRNRLVHLTDEQRSLEQTLKRTSQLYRQAHNERRQMISTWKDAVNQMNQREHDITEADIEIERSRELTTIKMEKLTEATKLYELQCIHNSEIEREIEELNATQSDLQMRFNELQETMKLNGNELLSLRKTVQNVATKLANQRMDNHKLSKDEYDKEAAVRRGVADLENLKQKYENFKCKTMNAQERLRQLDEFVEAEEKTCKNLDDETNRLNAALFRSEQQLYKLQEQAKLLELEGQSVEASIGRTKANYKSDQKEYSRQMGISYNLEFNIQQLETRIENMKGSKSPDEDLQLQERVRFLDHVHGVKKHSLDVVNEQITKMEDELRKMTTEFNNGSLEVEKLSGRLKEKKLLVEGGEKMFKQELAINQEKMVEMSLIKMKVRQMEKALARHEDKVYSLEKHKMELEAAINERLMAIKAQNEMLALKKKYLTEERSQLRADISERDAKINALKNRYSCAMDLLGKNEDGSLVTATQIKIELAQEKYMLLKQGNELNEKVLKAEEDVKLMENALKLMQQSNDSYKRSFEKVEDNSAELKHFNDLHNEYCKHMHKLKGFRMNLSEKMKKLEALTNEKEQLEKEVEEAERNRLDSNDTLIKIQKEFIDQREKLERAERELKLAIRAVRRRFVDSDFLQLFEKDLNTRELEDRDNSALQQLADCVEAYPEMGPAVTRYLYEKGLKMPTRTQNVWRSGETLSDINLRPDRVCSRMTHKSFMSSTSSATSSLVSFGTKGTTKASVDISVVTLDFDTVSSAALKSVPSTSSGFGGGGGAKPKSKSSKF